MGRELTLHVGHAKTGSTSIQKNLAAERDQLRSLGILYPLTSIVPHNQRVLFIDIFEQADWDLRFRMEAKTEDAKAMARDEWRSVAWQLDRSGAGHLLLSAESFFGRNLDDHSATRLRRRLDELSCDTLRILCYLRSPTGLYISLAQQKLKGGHGLIKPVSPQHAPRIKACSEYLGTDVELRIFDRSKLVGGDVVADFVDWMNLPGSLFQNAVVDANKTISAEAMALLCERTKEMSISSSQAFQRKRQLVRVVRKHDKLIEEPTSPKLRAEVSDWIVRTDGDLLPLRDEFGIEFPDIDYAIAGVGSTNAAPRVEEVNDICNLNIGRLAELRARVGAELAKLG